MAKRTDPHRVGAIVPAHYQHVLSYEQARMEDGWPVPSFGVNCELDRRTETKDEDGHVHVHNGKHNENGLCCVLGLLYVAKVKWASHGNTGKCSVCGAHFSRGDVWVHEPTGEHIHIGWECAEKYELLVDRSEFEMRAGNWKRAMGAYLQAKKNEKERSEFLEEHPGLAEALKTDHHIVRDIAGRFHADHALTDKQIALVMKLAYESHRPPEPTVKAPEGKQSFRGKVVSLKSQESAYGTTIKITVKVETQDGVWLAWGTAPAAILDAACDALRDGLAQGPKPLMGATVELTATLGPGRDPHFAIMGRPRGKVLEFVAPDAVQVAS